MRDLPFLYEDNHVLAVDKPAGMLSQGDLTGDLDVLTLAKEIIRQRDKKPGNVYLGLVHRLDRPVGGAMVIAKTSKAAGRLSKQFRERSTKKIYRAVVQGTPELSEANLQHRLYKDRARRVTRVVGPDKDGKDGELRYYVMESRTGKSLVEVRLITGLPHQIRAQLSAIGHPVLGDRKYGAQRPLPAGNIALFSSSLTFIHPVKNEPMTISAVPPDNWPW
ncbi:MAG: RluA family pseudouridine synthase [Deltaproteobacteria bacterium]|nr:RluA family pseudouridine synthase [Deltaproteobacteria bacterium]